MRFLALDCSYELIVSLRPVLARLHRADRSLASQMKRAAASVSLNLAEGSGREGQDRLQHYRIACGSAREVEAVLHVAHSFGYLGNQNIDACITNLDKLIAMIRGLLR